MSKTNILVAEDEAIVAEDLSRKLSRLGYDVVGIAASGKQALALTRERRPALVLMDIRLEGQMDGVDAAQVIRREYDIPVIFLMAHSDSVTLQRAKLTEPFGYILKPFEAPQLETQIQMALYKHQADREVQRQREWLRVTLQSIGDAVITTDAEGKVTSLNPVAEELTGWKMAEALNRLLLEIFNIVNEETRQPVFNPVGRVLKEGNVVGLANHTALISRAGRETAIEGSAATIKDAQGRILGVVMVFHDVTEKRQAEKQMRDSGEQLKRAQRIAHLGSWELDLVQNRLTWSDEVYRIFGMEPRQFDATYKAFLERVHPEDRASVDAAYNGSLREGRDSYEIEHRVVRHDTGEIRMVHEKCEHCRDASGRILSSVGMVHDITDRKRAEEEARRGQVRLAQAVRVAGLGTFEHDHLTDIIEFSPVMRELVRFEAGEEVTIPAILEKVVPEDREALGAAIRRAHESGGGGLFEVEYRVVNRHGKVRWISARSQTFFEGEGSGRHPARTIGAALDVTERKEIQAELQRLVDERTAKLKELVGELEHFSYTITHDMRAPLRGMQGFAEMMAEQCAGCSDHDATGFLRRIRTSASRMDLLITDALNYSRAVRHELPLGPVDVAALLRGMLDSYPELQSSKADITIKGEIPRVLGNEAGLTQCFSNLLGNAVKFVQPGQKAEVRIWAEVRGDAEKRVRIWVEDNGIGVPKEMLSRVFDMFSRGQNTYEGTGIGLALVRKVVQRMGGRVGLESEEGKGSRFWVELPCAEREAHRG